MFNGSIDNSWISSYWLCFFYSLLYWSGLIDGWCYTCRQRSLSTEYKIFMRERQRKSNELNVWICIRLTRQRSFFFFHLLFFYMITIWSYTCGPLVHKFIPPIYCFKNENSKKICSQCPIDKPNIWALFLSLEVLFIISYDLALLLW